jgi:hypothetical protein
MMEDSSPKPRTSVWKTLTAIVEVKIGKLSPKVPIRSSMTRIGSEILRSQTWRNPSRNPPAVRRALMFGYSSDTRNGDIEIKTAVNDSSPSRPTINIASIPPRAYELTLAFVVRVCGEKK